MTGTGQGGLRFERLVTAAVIATMTLLFATMLLPDETISWLLKEERPIELIGAFGLLASAVLALLLWRHHRRTAAPRWRTLACLGFAALFFVAFGEEISWGQRIFGWGTPESFSSVNAQDETNFHNLDFFSGGLNADNLFLAFWVIVGVLIPLASLHAPIGERLNRLMPVMPVLLVAAFVFNQVVTKIFARILDSNPDLYDGTKYPASYGLVEIKESGVAITFAAGFWILYRHATRQRQEPEPASVNDPELVGTNRHE